MQDRMCTLQLLKSGVQRATSAPFASTLPLLRGLSEADVVVRAQSSLLMSNGIHRFTCV